jgi:hypothetical protein
MFGDAMGGRRSGLLLVVFGRRESMSKLVLDSRDGK